jgi:hypothetical protein
MAERHHGAALATAARWKQTGLPPLKAYSPLPALKAALAAHQHNVISVKGCRTDSVNFADISHQAAVIEACTQTNANPGTFTVLRNPASRSHPRRAWQA